MNEQHVIDRLRSLDGETPAITVAIGPVLRAGRRRRAARAAAMAAGSGAAGLAVVVAVVTVWPGHHPPSPPPAASTTATRSAPPTTTAPGEPASSIPVDVPAAVLLPASAWEDITGPRVESDRVVDWRLPAACDGGAPSGAESMRTVTQGTGELEATVGVQQVAVFPGAEAAVAEADRLGAALSACAQTGADGGTTYVLEDLAVGAQGAGLATDYYGTSTSGELDEALGSYLAVTRRGNAVTLVALDGGESTVGAARDTVTGRAQAAWELLCRYSADGC